MPYIYEDGDNAPMNEEAWEHQRHQWKKEEIPFSEPPDGCWNCLEYNGDFCTLYWNNLDECYLQTERDLREPTDYCDQFQRNPTIKPEEYFK